MQVVSQLLDALQYMHSQSFCHRDLKLENLLIDQGTLQLKVGPAQDVRASKINVEGSWSLPSQQLTSSSFAPLLTCLAIRIHSMPALCGFPSSTFTGWRSIAADTKEATNLIPCLCTAHQCLHTF